MEAAKRIVELMVQGKSAEASQAIRSALYQKAGEAIELRRESVMEGVVSEGAPQKK